MRMGGRAGGSVGSFVIRCGYPPTKLSTSFLVQATAGMGTAPGKLPPVFVKCRRQRRAPMTPGADPATGRRRRAAGGHDVRMMVGVRMLECVIAPCRSGWTIPLLRGAASTAPLLDGIAAATVAVVVAVAVAVVVVALGRQPGCTQTWAAQRASETHE